MGESGMESREVQAGQFKQQCLKLMDEVAVTRVPLVVTKHGKPIVRWVPAEDHPASSFGSMAGTVTILGDIVASLDVPWDADA